MFYFFKGRVALYAILKAMGIGPGDEVILPGYTCIVVPNAILYLGAKPVYIDIDPGTYNIDPKKIEAGKGKSWTVGKAKAVIAQHTYGIPADMSGILEISRRYNLSVVEDNCHTADSLYRGKRVGTFGDAAFFSSQWSKPVSTGLGGWAVIHTPELGRRMGEIYPEFLEPNSRDVYTLRLQHFLHSVFYSPEHYWIAQGAYRLLSKMGIAIGSSKQSELECRMPSDYKKRMSFWQREKLEHKMVDVSAIVKHRRRVVSRYEKILPDLGMEPVRLSEEYDTVFLRYPVVVKNKEEIMAEARKKRIEIGDWFVSPVHPVLKGWEKAGYVKGSCPVAEDICRHVINLPTHRKVDERETERIIDFLKEHARGKGSGRPGA